MNLDSIKKLGITNIGDPFIIRVDKTYYMYATSFVDGFYAWKSTDLKNWSAPKQVYKKGARSFGSSDFWAPEVVCRNGKYIMHYTARRAVDDTLYIGVAVSDAPMGGFIDVYDKKPMFDFGYAVIDAHVLIDGDKRYLFFDRDCSQYIVDGNHESHILAVELDETLTKVVSEPVLVIKPDQEWETCTGDFRWTEGAFIVKRNGLYYLMYSAGFYAAPSYSMGYAVSDKPLGPYVKYRENPVMRTVKGFMSGPGHNSVFTTPDGASYCAFHIHTQEDDPGPNRQACIRPIDFHGDKIIFP